MKHWLLKISIRNIKKFYPNYSDIKIKEIKYGLEAIYLTLTKIIIMLIISCFLGILKDVITLTVSFGIIRSSGFGLHASRSWICLITSLTVFIGIPILCRLIIFPTYIVLTLALICIVLFIKYAPADTNKRPLINKKQRIHLKFIAITTSTIYFIIISLINASFIKNILLMAMILEVILILPFTYKVFGYKYDNYKHWKP